MTSIETVNASRRVLVVDDVMLNRKLAIAFLSRMGWQTFETDGGLAALEWLANNPPVDVLLLDISMPDLCGESVCEQLRANPAFGSLKIVAYTAHAGSDDTQRFLANGFNAVLIKPISSQRLKDVLAELVGSDG
ncbi:MAG: response regulator [Rhodoferax sp.]|uniref:response regulator n=1 Tax=Rhodoferax sp. TaxID=50421 RepID=UPI002611A9B2|nr:response regulator [Rhodoferax sp.]MDD2879967.1 response regulator [Rhodoferax sp.]